MSESTRTIGGIPVKPQRRQGRVKNARRTAYDGVVYDSQAEAQRARDLDRMKAAGEIRGWLRQPTFFLGVTGIRYRADFLVFRKDGRVHAEDVKGHQTERFLQNKRLWRRHGLCDLHVIGRNDIEIVTPERFSPLDGDLG